MNLISYVGLKVNINLSNDFYYSGIVLSVDDNSITIRDLKDKIVTININSILTIKEIDKR